MGCACNGPGKPAVRWRFTTNSGQTMDDGKTTVVKKHKHEVDWLLRRYGGTIEKTTA